MLPTALPTAPAGTPTSPSVPPSYFPNEPTMSPPPTESQPIDNGGSGEQPADESGMTPMHFILVALSALMLMGGVVLCVRRRQQRRDSFLANQGFLSADMNGEYVAPGSNGGLN
jgi:hypothetical protein